MLKDSIYFFDFEKITSQFVLIVLAIVIGIVIGLEREYSNKSAGLRTFILVAFGSAVFTLLSIEIGVANPDRLAANIITGIGFLGAGVIFKDNNKIGGITTATTIWATASLGMSAGSGHVYLAILGTVVVIVILRLLLPLQKYIDSHHKIREYRIVTASYEDRSIYPSIFKDCQLKYSLVAEQKNSEGFSCTWRVAGRLQRHEQLVERLVRSPEVVAYQF